MLLDKILPVKQKNRRLPMLKLLAAPEQVSWKQLSVKRPKQICLENRLSYAAELLS